MCSVLTFDANFDGPRLSRYSPVLCAFDHMRRLEVSALGSELLGKEMEIISENGGEFVFVI